MKIAFFADSYEPQINGMVTTLKLYTKYLRKNGHEVVIFAPAVPNYRDKDKEVYRIKSVSLPTYKEYRIGIPEKTLLRIRKMRFDIINIHSPFSLGLAGLALANKSK